VLATSHFRSLEPENACHLSDCCIFASPLMAGRKTPLCVHHTIHQGRFYSMVGNLSDSGTCCAPGWSNQSMTERETNGEETEVAQPACPPLRLGSPRLSSNHLCSTHHWLLHSPDLEATRSDRAVPDLDEIRSPAPTIIGASCAATFSE
jgi:hypothetical protein